MALEIFLVISIIQLAISFGLLGFFVFSVVAFIIGAPFVPTGGKRLRKMLEFAGVMPGQKVADLGSGDGRLVIAFAKAGAEAHGYEINPLLVLYSNILIFKSGLRGKAHIHLKSFWGEDLSLYNTITVYGISHIMERLEQKFSTELNPGARVVSNSFRLPSWLYSRQEDGVYLYEKGHFNT